MFDIAWSELVVIGAVALVVIGPKDLPKALRSVGEMVGKVRRMASEFQGQFNEAMREAELHDLKKSVEDIGGSVQAATRTDFNPIQTIRDEIKGATDGKPAGDAAVQDAAAQNAAMAAAEAKLASIPPPEPPPPVKIDPPASVAANVAAPVAGAASAKKIRPTKALEPAADSTPEPQALGMQAHATPAPVADLPLAPASVAKPKPAPKADQAVAAAPAASLPAPKPARSKKASA
jgi:sec-independent protein translocase protein TatB